MWDLETIVRINHEAWRSAKKKDSLKACLEASIKRNEGIFRTQDRVFRETSYLRSVYEGEVDGCSSQGREGETLP
jgi:hypothetical protein